MIKNILKLVDRLFPPSPIYAHCDIPCGIYDPHLAQVAAHTVLRMTHLIKESKNDLHAVARLTAIKEEHAELVKHEVRIIWGDAIKPEHVQKFPTLHELVFNIMKIASKTKQNVDEANAKELLSKVQEFSEIFWQSKGLETKRCASTFPTKGEIVVPKV